MVNVEGRTGVQSGQDGAIMVLRLAKDGSLVAKAAHGTLQEAVERGNVYVISNAVAGVAPGTALGTTPPMCIWNPTGSGKNVVILITTLGYVSGTLGAGTIAYALVTAQVAAPTTGTELVAQCALLDGTKGVARGFTGSTVVATPTLLKAAFIVGAALASSVAFPAQAKDYVDGEIVIPPGSCFVMQGIAAAGSTPLVIFSVTYEEVPA